MPRLIAGKNEDFDGAFYGLSDDESRFLRCALAPAPDTERFWNLWGDRPAPPEMSGNLFRLYPLLYSRFEEDNKTEVGLCGELKRYYFVTRTLNLLKFKAFKPVLKILKTSGIEPLYLKGAALGQTVYGDTGLRPIGDIDILVRRERAEEAALILESAGWTMSRDRPRQKVFRDLHGISFKKGGHALDLHWHVLWCCRSAGADDDFWSASLPFDFEGLTGRMLCPEDQLVHICAHGARKGNNPYSSAHDSYLQWIPDAVLLLRKYPDLNWDRIIAQAAGRALRAQLLRAFRYLAREFEAPIPERVFTRLSRRPFSYREKKHERYTSENWQPRHLKKLRGFLKRYETDYLQTIRVGRESRWDRLHMTARFPDYLRRHYGFRSLPEAFTGCLRKLVRSPRILFK